MVGVRDVGRIYTLKEQALHEGLSNLGRLFQSVEYRTNNATVGGSSPSSTIFAVRGFGFLLPECPGHSHWLSISETPRRCSLLVVSRKPSCLWASAAG
jgi:hypothetical protein